jgi:hypothetical protein
MSKEDHATTNATKHNHNGPSSGQPTLDKVAQSITLQHTHTAIHCNTQHHTATHFNTQSTLQHRTAQSSTPVRLRVARMIDPPCSCKT